MRVYKEMKLKEFKFWGGAKDVAKLLTDEEFEYLESILEDGFAIDGETTISETIVNNFIWFEALEQLTRYFGLEDEDDVWIHLVKRYEK